MARPKTIRIKKVLQDFLPRRRLERLAKEARLVQRRRKVSVYALFWTLVLGFGSGRHRTLAGLRRAFQVATGVTLVPSAFYDRFTPGLVRFLKLAVGDVLGKVAEPKHRLGGALASFRDLVIADATVIRLHNWLAWIYPACRTNHTLAALKLHAVLSVSGAGPRSIRVTSERVHDGPVLRVGPWMKDRLLLFDLAFFRFQLFSCIRRNGGFFVIRLKKSADPLIMAAHQRGDLDLVAHHVSEVLPWIRRQAIDVEVEVSFKGRRYAGIRRTRAERFRLVAVRDPATGDYHVYLTNIPPDRLSAVEIAQIYAARWLVELFFREVKARYRIDNLPTRSPVVVEALLYAALLTFAVSRALLAALRKKLAALGDRVRDERWAALFAEVARDLLLIVLRKTADSVGIARGLDRLLLHEAVDPNLHRNLLRQRVENRLQYHHRVSVGAAHA
jgi:IS4 transposase